MHEEIQREVPSMHTNPSNKRRSNPIEVSAYEDLNKKPKKTPRNNPGESTPKVRGGCVKERRR